MSGPGDAAHAALARALTAMTGASLAGSRETLWASSGFTGWRHVYSFDLGARDDPAALARLDSTEFDLPGHIVADIALVARERDAHGCRITIEALTVEDR